MNVQEYYTALGKKRLSIIEQAIADDTTFSKHIIAHNYLKEFDSLRELMDIESRYVFDQFVRELQYALEAVSCGNYRRAFSSLRLSFELALGSIYFSANIFKLKLWINGLDDLYWSNLVDQDNGVYSHNFCNAFFSELRGSGNQYFTLASTVYRECSEYVHGNPKTHEDAMADICYDQEKAVSFYDKIDTIRLCVLFAFAVRYLLSLDRDGRSKVEAMMLDAFGDMAEVQSVFEKVGA